MNQQAVKPAPEVSDHQAQFRSQVGHISRHSGVFFAGTLFSIGLGYLFKVYLARVLGAEALGIYALGMTLIGFLGAFNNLGLVESAVRFASLYCATDKWNELRSLLWRGGAIIFAANLLFSVILLVLGAKVAIRFYHSPELAHYMPWFVALSFLGVMTTFYGRVLAGYKQVGRRTLITNFIGTPANMLFAVVLISLGWGLRGYLLAQVLSAAVVIFLILAFVWRFTPPGARLSWSWPPPLEREVWSFSAAAVGVLFLAFVMGHVDKIALGYFRGAREVGIYSVSAAMVAYISIVLSSVNQVFSPLIADLHSRQDKAMLERLYKALTKWVLGLTLPLAIVVMVFATPLLRIFGPDFEAGWPVLIIGTIGQLVNCGVGSVGLLLLMSGNQHRLLRVQAAMAAVMAIASAALVPLWGIVGAAVAAAIANAGTNAWNLLEVRKVLGLSPFSRGYLQLLAPSVTTFAAAILLRHESALLGRYWIGISVSLVACYLVFAGTMMVFGLDEDDRLVTGALRARLRRSVPIAKGVNVD